MMGAARSAPSIRSCRNARNGNAGNRHHPATVINLRDVVSQRKLRSDEAGPGAQSSASLLPAPEARPRRRPWSVRQRRLRTPTSAQLTSSSGLPGWLSA